MRMSFMNEKSKRNLMLSDVRKWSRNHTILMLREFNVSLKHEQESYSTSGLKDCLIASCRVSNCVKLINC